MTLHTTMTPPIPKPIVTDPRNAATNRQIGSQITTEPIVIKVSSESEHPLKIAGSAFKRSVSKASWFGKLKDACRFGE